MTLTVKIEKEKKRTLKHCAYNPPDVNSLFWQPAVSLNPTKESTRLIREPLHARIEGDTCLVSRVTCGQQVI